MRSRSIRKIHPTLAVAVLALVAPFAFAASPTQDAAPAEETQAQDAAAAPAEQKAQAGKHHCLRSTGSLITTRRNHRARRENRDEQCAPVFGRVYSREDLHRTGFNDIGSALRTLDPSIY